MVSTKFPKDPAAIGRLKDPAAIGRLEIVATIGRLTEIVERFEISSRRVRIGALAKLLELMLELELELLLELLRGMIQRENSAEFSKN